MRKLAIFSFAFAAAAALYVYLLSPVYALAAAALLALALAALCFFRYPWTKRIRIAALGLLLGLVWSFGYEQRNIAPSRSLCGDNVELTVTVCGYPEPSRYGVRVAAEAGKCTMLVYLDEEAALRPGDTLHLQAHVVDVSAGEDENLYYAAKDIRLLAFQRGEPEIIRAARVPVRYLPTVWSHLIRERISQLFAPDTEAFVRALLTGDRSGLSYETKNQMAISGISHVVAVSGLHVSLIGSFVLLVCLRRRRLAAWVSIAAMLLFAAMLGFPPSVVRAVVMHTVLLLAPVFGRENDYPTSMGFALLLILLANPWSIASVSLQLSFAATAGILLFGNPLLHWQETRFLPKKFRRRHPHLASLLRGIFSIQATSIGATALTFPLVALYFDSVSLIAPITNLLLLTLTGYVFTAGCAAVALSFAVPVAGKGLAWLLNWAVRLILRIIAGLSRIPFAAVYPCNNYLRLWVLVLGLLTLVFMLGKYRAKRTFAAAIAATLACALAFSMLPGNAKLDATVLDVGQGQCILLQSGGLTAVVDCGGSYPEDSGEQLARRLLMQGKTQVDFLILTHYDSDHSGGVEQLLSRMEVGMLLAPDIEDKSGNREAVLSAAERAGTAVRLVTQDTEITFPDGTLRIFAPVGSGTNNGGISALMSVEEYDILITGDMDAQTEQLLAVRQELHDIEVLIAGHHGSRNSTGKALLQTISPELVVVSAGENSYGHPAPATLARIQAAGAEMLCTDECGDIEIQR